jgi:16S rRNA G966 N2-methylase RsmD
LRQALFNSIQTIMPGCRVLDLFAGSGALGFEALSRGAESVVFVESSRAALKLIEKNAEILGVTDRVQIVSEPLIGRPVPGRTEPHHHEHEEGRGGRRDRRFGEDRRRELSKAVENQTVNPFGAFRAIWPLLHHSAPFDLVLADPPYGGGWEKILLDELPWEQLLVADGYFCLEWGIQKSQDYKASTLPERTPHLVKVREKNYGDSVLSSYRLTGAPLEDSAADAGEDL